MLDTLTLSDILKIIAKRFKLIIIIALLCAIIATSLFLYMKSDEDKITYEIKMYCVVNFTDTQNMNTTINYVINTVHDVLKSDAVKSSLKNINFDEISDSKFLKGYDAANLIESDKIKISDAIFSNYKVEFNETPSKIFTLSFKSADKSSAEYISQFIFARASEIVSKNVDSTSIKLINKELVVTENDLFSYKNLIKNIILFGAASFFFVCFIYIIFVLSTDKVLNANQLKRKYKLDIITLIKNKSCNYKELKSVLLYKLNKKSAKTVILTSSNNKIDKEFICNLKAEFEEDNIKSAFVTDKFDDYLNDIYRYGNLLNHEKNDFWNKLNHYDCILVLTDSILVSNITEELLFRFKNIVLIEKCGVSKFEQIDRTIEKIKMFDGEVEGFILIK